MQAGETEALPDILLPQDDAGGSEEDAEGQDARRRLRNGLISLLLLVALVVGLLLAVPGLHGVSHAVTHMKAGWLVAAVGLEVLSCLGYVLAFLQVFSRAPIRFGARVALSELAFNAAVSIGGAGSVAVGAWLLIERGAPVQRVAQRSAVLFLLTSAINVITLTLGGLALLFGILPGPHNVLLALIPAVVGGGVFLLFLQLPRLLDRAAFRKLPARVRVGLQTTVSSIRDTEGLLFSLDWRTLGAIGYLWFDIAVLLACLVGAGASPPLLAVVLAYQIGYLSNLIPIPGGIGILDGALVGSLVLYGVPVVRATAATVVYHAISLWIPAVWGSIAFVVLRRTRRQPLKLRPERSRRVARSGAPR